MYDCMTHIVYITCATNIKQSLEMPEMLLLLYALQTILLLSCFKNHFKEEIIVKVHSIHCLQCFKECLDVAKSFTEISRKNMKLCYLPFDLKFQTKIIEKKNISKYILTMHLSIFRFIKRQCTPPRSKYLKQYIR